MTNTEMEKQLRGFDFSKLSKVKGSLLQNLLERHRQDNAPKAWWRQEQMSTDDLDMVIAAGNNPYGYEPKKD